MHPESHGSGEAVCVRHEPDDGGDSGVRGGPTIGGTATPGYLRPFHQAGHGDLRTVGHAARVQLPRFPPHGDGSAAIMAANMLRLLPANKRGNNIVFREIFLRKIPPAIREVLGELRKEDKDLLVLARRVDALIASRPATGATTSCIGAIGKGAKPKQKSQDPVKKSPPGGWCWYHRKHREAAKNCKAPCTFPSKITEIQEN